MEKIRLHSFLAKMGIDSRRKCEKLIVQGKVKVNGVVITELGTKINPYNDKVEVNNKIIKKNIPKIYILLNKPRGYLCTTNDPLGRPTIFHIIKKIKVKLSYAGRLDFDSEGLVFLTNDGVVINKITQPQNKVNKVYVVKVKGIPKEKDLKLLEQGIPLSPIFTTSPCQVKILKKNRNISILKIIIREGKKRQIKRMFSYLGFQVLKLKRIQIGILKVNGLKTGQYRFLKKLEIKKLTQYLENN